MTDATDDADIRLLDFGLSKIIGPTEKCTEPYGTLSYVAPEVLREKPYGFAVDLWSIGIITYLLLCGFLPFDDENSEREIARQTIQDPVPYPPQVWSKLSPEAKSFVEGLLKKKPEERWGKNGNSYKPKKGCRSHFWNAIQKDGWDNFKHEILKDNFLTFLNLKFLLFVHNIFYSYICIPFVKNAWFKILVGSYNG